MSHSAVDARSSADRVQQVLEEEDDDVDRDDGLGDGRDAPEQAGARGFSPDVFAVVDAHGGSAPAGRDSAPDATAIAPRPIGSARPPDLFPSIIRLAVEPVNGGRGRISRPRPAGRWTRGGATGRAPARSPRGRIEPRRTAQSSCMASIASPLRLIDRPDHVERGDPQELARAIVHPGNAMLPAPRDDQLPAADQQGQEHRSEIADPAEVEDDQRLLLALRAA